MENSSEPNFENIVNDILDVDIDEAFEKAKAGATIVEDEVRSFVRERPLVALGAAIAAGYLFGRILVRK